MRLPALTTALVALVLVLAGCGDDEAGESGAATSETTTSGQTDPEPSDANSPSDPEDAADVAPEADSVCAEIGSELAAVEGGLDEAGSSDEFVAAIDDALPGLEADLAELEALAGRDGDGALAQLAERQGDAIEALAEMRDAAEAEDVEGIQALGGELEELSVETERLARQAGLEECAGG